MPEGLGFPLFSGWPFVGASEEKGLSLVCELLLFLGWFSVSFSEFFDYEVVQPLVYVAATHFIQQFLDWRLDSARYHLATLEATLYL